MRIGSGGGGARLCGPSGEKILWPEGCSEKIEKRHGIVISYCCIIFIASKSSAFKEQQFRSLVCELSRGLCWSGLGMADLDYVYSYVFICPAHKLLMVQQPQNKALRQGGFWCLEVKPQGLLWCRYSLSSISFVTIIITFIQIHKIYQIIFLCFLFYSSQDRHKKNIL